MKAGNFLFNLIVEWNCQDPIISTNASVCEIPETVCHALGIFRKMDYNIITLIQFKFTNYNIIIKKVNRITKKSIYSWKCTYKQTKE